MATARAAARSLIETAEARGMGVSNLKLQKLLYFAHGNLLASKGIPLVDEEFQAWKYGPVIESLYHDLKGYGPDYISASEGLVGTWEGLRPEHIAERSIIKSVLDKCGDFSAGHLVKLSHDSNGPWASVYNSDDGGIVIKNEDIAKYFVSLRHAKRQSSSA